MKYPTMLCHFNFFFSAEKGTIYYVAATGQIWLQVNFDLT